MKKISNKSIIAVLTACLVFAMILAVSLTAVLTRKAPMGGGTASGDGITETAIITDAGKSTDALEDGDVPSGYSASGTVVTASNFMELFTKDSQSGTYVLNSDITLLYTPPKATQSGTPRLKSGVTFDGNGHTITLTYASASRTGIGYEDKNLTVYGNMSYLFDYIAGTVKNLKVVFNGQTINNQFNNTGHWCGVAIGVMCARLNSTGRIENSKVTLNAKMTFFNSVSGSSGYTDLFFGAFAGYGEGTLQNCTTVVDNNTYVNVYAEAKNFAKTKSRFGGIVGYSTATLKVINCSFKNERTSTATYLRLDGTSKHSGFAIGNVKSGGSLNGFIYTSNTNDIRTGIENYDGVGLVVAIYDGSTLNFTNIYANQPIVSTNQLVANSVNQGCINILKSDDTSKVDIYFDKSNTSNIVFKLKDNYASTGILWSITHGKSGALDLSSMKDVSGSLARCVSIPKYDGGVNADAGSSINIVYGTSTVLHLNNATVEYSNSDIDMRNDANISLATNGVTKNPSAFNILYNGGTTLPRNVGTYTMSVTNQVAGTDIVYYDTTNFVAAVAGNQGSVTVNRRNLTMEPNGEYFTVSEKIYDGSADHTSGVTGSLNGVNGEKVNFIIDEAFYISNGTWQGDAHTLATPEVANATRLRIEFHLDSANYKINNSASDLTQPRTVQWTQTGGITPRNIEVDGSYFSVADKTYDGTTTATAEQIKTVKGINDLDLTLTNLSAAFNSANVADANTVTISFRNSDTNYKINNALANNDATVSISKKISPKQISVTFDDNLVQSYRDKSAIDTVNCVVIDGLVPDDVVTVTGMVVDGVDFTRFGKYILSAHVDTENYYSTDTAELTMIYFKQGANVGEWLIENIDDFNMINDNAYYLALNYVQSGDIDAYYSVVDSVKGDFSGSYNGGGFTIKNFVMIADGANNGLFENVIGSISDLMVANATINGYLSGANVGGIVGSLAEGATLTNVAFVGDIYVYGNNNNVGGIVGTNSGAITAGTVIGDIFVNGDNNVVGSAIGTNTSVGSMTGGVLFVPIEVKGTGNTATIRAGVNDGGTISTDIRIIAKSVINNGVTAGSGSSASALFAVVAYQGQTVLDLLNTYRNKMNIDLNAAKNEIEISNVNDLSLLREYRYLKFKLTADITMHIDSYAGFPVQIGGLNLNGFKIYTTDGKTLDELNIA